MENQKMLADCKTVELFLFGTIVENLKVILLHKNNLKSGIINSITFEQLNQVSKPKLF